MGPCPYEKRGRHHLGVIVPETSEHPAVLFCEMCGATRHVSLAVPPPLDDMTADDIARIANGGRP